MPIYKTSKVLVTCLVVFFSLATSLLAFPYQKLRFSQKVENSIFFRWVQERIPANSGFGAGGGESQGSGTKARVMDKDDLRYLSSPPISQGEVLAIDYASKRIFLDVEASPDVNPTLRGSLNIVEFSLKNLNDIDTCLNSIKKGDIIILGIDHETLHENNKKYFLEECPDDLKINSLSGGSETKSEASLSDYPGETVRDVYLENALPSISQNPRSPIFSDAPVEKFPGGSEKKSYSGAYDVPGGSVKKLE